MGCSSSSPEIVTSFDIDTQLEKARDLGKQKIKVLLLGAGESGKSTILKQMRIIHGPEWSDEELRMYGVIVRSNIIVATMKLCKELHALKLEKKLAKEPVSATSGSMTPKQAYKLLVERLINKNTTTIDKEELNESAAEDWVGHSSRAGALANQDAQLFLRYWQAIQVLMECKTMQEVWSHHSAVNVIDGHEDFLRDVARIASPTYRPRTRDILLARARTTNVTKESYNLKGVTFEFYDVGGQRALRHKWLDCFNNVDAVIFMAALPGYDQTLTESRTSNRMVEALDLFRAVANHPAFQKSFLMLFLNKKDIFMEKILHSHIADQKPFNNFKGQPRNFSDGVEYFIDAFLDCVLDNRRKVFVHVTCATDTQNMEFVLDSTRSVIMEENLKSSFNLIAD